MPLVRRLKQAGIDRFEAFLDSLKSPTPLPRPVEALEYDDTSEPLEIPASSRSKGRHLEADWKQRGISTRS